MWTFLSLCVTGEAENTFKGTDQLHGLDAWRRLVRQIDRGRSTRREHLRREVKDLYRKHIRALDQVESSIVAFDNLIQEYHEHDGPLPSEFERKSDLHNILPSKLK